METTYEAWFNGVRADAQNWADSNFCNPKEPPCTPEQLAEFAGEFMGRAGSYVEELGANELGEIIWYLCGVGRELWTDIRTAPEEVAEAAILRVRDLYSGCFARHIGLDENENKLASACFMLWDMDTLDCVLHPPHDAPERLVRACYSVLEFALAQKSPACWKSALHGLGHVLPKPPEPGRSLISNWMTLHEDIPADILGYANAAWDGGVL